MIAGETEAMILRAKEGEYDNFKFGKKVGGLLGIGRNRTAKPPRPGQVRRQQRRDDRRTRRTTRKAPPVPTRERESPLPMMPTIEPPERVASASSEPASLAKETAAQQTARQEQIKALDEKISNGFETINQVGQTYNNTKEALKADTAQAAQGDYSMNMGHESDDPDPEANTSGIQPWHYAVGFGVLLVGAVAYYKYQQGAINLAPTH